MRRAWLLSRERPVRVKRAPEAPAGGGEPMTSPTDLMRAARHRIAAVFGVALLWLGCGLAAHAAEPFCPEANIKIVSPFPPGGPTDITARLLGEKLRVQFGQNVI